MSPLNSLAGGYKGGDKSSPAPQLKSVPRDYNQELLNPIEEYYRNNNLSEDDLKYLKENCICFKNDTKYDNSISPSKLAYRIYLLIQMQYADKKIDIDEIIKGLINIMVEVTQKPQIIPKKPETGVVKSKINTLTGYGGGSPKVRSENSRPQIVKTPTKVPIDQLISKIRMWYADKNLSEDDLNAIMEELIKMK